MLVPNQLVFVTQAKTKSKKDQGEITKTTVNICHIEAEERGLLVTFIIPVW